MHHFKRDARFNKRLVEAKRVVLNFGARALKSASSEITNSAAWYVSYLDSDTA